jgi:transmembrane sensor
MKAERNLARYVQPPLSSSRLDRQWSAVSERTKGGLAAGRSWTAIGLALAAACVLVLIFAVHPFRSKAIAFEGAALETSSSSQLLTLADGSRVELAEATRLEFSTMRPDAVRLLLTRGAVDLDVAHVEGRTFTVAAAGVDVTVRGTRFRVAVSEAPVAELTVSVQRGRVEASRPGSGEPSRAIGAGETWSTAAVTPGRQETTASPQPAPAVSEEAAAPAGEVPSPQVDPGASAETGNRFSELVKARKFGDAYATLGPHGFARELERADAKRLLELADAARFSGHVREAVTPLDRLRRKFRSDPRAALAAFELGRLRMDSLGDPSGALEAFADAIALAPSGPVREDAQARQVQALETLGDMARCAQARDAYLARFPNGIHATSIRGRCGAK